MSKQNLSRNVILDNFEVNKSFAKEDLKAVFYLNEHTVCDTHDLIKCDCQSGREPPKKENEEENGAKRRLLRQTRYKNSNSNADYCSAILKQWDHIGDCSKINDPIIVGAGVEKTLSFAFYSRSDKKVVNDDVKEVESNEEKDENEGGKNGENGENDNIEDVYIDVNEESNNNNKIIDDDEEEEEKEEKKDIHYDEIENINENERTLYEGDDVLFSDIDI